MSNIKWSGIEQWKYGLTARWYVSAYYGNDTDVDAVGLYNPSTNLTGHGGKERPFATLSKLFQQSSIGNVVLDSGYYDYSVGITTAVNFIGDGVVILSRINLASVVSFQFFNTININCSFANFPSSGYHDCVTLYSSVTSRMAGRWESSVFMECSITSGAHSGSHTINKCVFVRCSGVLPSGAAAISSCYIVSSASLQITTIKPRPVGRIYDYSVIIGTVNVSSGINGKTTGVTIEDFKADGNYFIKSFSEVDLFGNASGSGATVPQLNEIFNNFYYPYIDDYHNLDLTLRPDCDERVRFGGLNGTYIGALPVGYRLSASALWNTHIDVANTSNLGYDMVNNAIVLASGQDVGTYTSLIIDLGVPITVDMVDFLANFVYNIEGTAKQGVSNQRIDTTPDLLPDNTENQRVVYDYRLQYSPDGVTALTGWENLELNRMPTKDGAGLYQLEDGFNQAKAQKLTIQRLKIEFTLRRIIIA